MISSFALLLLAFMHTAEANVKCRLEVKNRSPKTIIISWIDPVTKEPNFVAEAGGGAHFGLDSWVGHEFQLIEKPNESTGSCAEDTCKALRFKVSESNHQLMIVTVDFQIIADQAPPSDDDTLPEDVVGYCRQVAQEKYEAKRGDPQTGKDIIEEFGECIKTGAMPKIWKLRDEINFHHDVRTTIARQMENFTCLDHTLGSSPDVDLQEWTSEKDHITRRVHVKLNRPASRIHVVENFVTPAECDAVEALARPHLEVASVVDGKGGSRQSDTRKAQQAALYPDFSVEGHPVSAVSLRVFDYTNHVLGLNITEHGQEGLMAIQYSGRGFDDSKPDRYMRHCDGICHGQQHRYGSRVATMLMYCKLPEKGGMTNFQDAGVLIKPKAFSAVFFSYIDPATNLMDKGLTRHSGCPVYEGEKKILTQWVRHGVNANERHFQKFNTLDILYTESAESQ